MKDSVSSEDLKLIRLFLPKNTGIAAAAEQAKCCKNKVYKNLSNGKDSAVILAALTVIENTAIERLAFAQKMKAQIKDTEQRV